MALEAPEFGRIYVKIGGPTRGSLNIVILGGSCTVRDAESDGKVGSRWGGLVFLQSGFARVTNGKLKLC